MNVIYLRHLSTCEPCDFRAHFRQLIFPIAGIGRIHDPFRSNSSKEMKELSFLNIPEHQQEQYIV